MKLDPLNAQGGTSEARQEKLSLRCPLCGHFGAFESFKSNDIHFTGTDVRIGFRLCPRPACRAVLYVVYRANEILLTEPRQVIDFDASGIPEPIVSALEEAITCHANDCHVAAGIMVRKTLEVLCDHEGASGGDLKKRIADLRTKVVLPPALIDGLDELRILGNDAAHVEARVYDEIGAEEIELAIDVAKEIMKSLYQTQTLLDRLQALKAKPDAT